MDDRQIWDLIKRAWSALQAKFEPEIEKALQVEGVNPQLWGLLVTLLAHDPQHVDIPDLLIRSPFTAADYFKDRLSDAMQAGLVERDQANRYGLSATGHKVLGELIRAAREKMAQVDPLSISESQPLTLILGRLVQSSLETIPPPRPWGARLSYQLMPAKEPPLPYIEQAFTSLAAYREDSHLVAWRNTDLSVTTLEVLTLFWRGEVTTFDDVCRKLAHRGHECGVYENVIHRLLEKGYLEGPNDSPWITAAGRVLRNRVETETDSYFFKPWRILTPVDRDILDASLTRLSAGLA